MRHLILSYEERSNIDVGFIKIIKESLSFVTLFIKQFRDIDIVTKSNSGVV